MKIERFGKITLINGDCMEYMRECKDKHFDVLVADPPYGDANFQNPPSEEIATGGKETVSHGRHVVYEIQAQATGYAV